MTQQQIIPAASGVSLRLYKGEKLRIIDIEGGQSGDLVAFSSDGNQRPTAFNFFMNVDVLPDGKLKFAPPKGRAGDSITMRAEMDLAIALSACPASTCNGGALPRSLGFQILIP